MAGVGPSADPRATGALRRLLADRPMSTHRLGLERIEALMAGLGHPDRTFRSIHIAGTNGKGSTAALLDSILRAGGHHTGLYTSPHLLTVDERIALAGAPAGAELLDRCADQVAATADRVEATYFEVLTAVAFLAFAEAGVEWAVVETGLGGRLDATTVLRPEAACITHIGKDHAEILGGSVPRIAAEKAGIFKANTPAFAGRIRRDALRVIETMARAQSVPLARLGREADVTRIETGWEGTAFTYRSDGPLNGRRLHTGLIGVHQAYNAGLATLVAERLLSAEPRMVDQGLAEARIPGRLERVDASDGRTWVFDLAHNASGVEALVQTLMQVSPPLPVVALVAILNDKPWATMVDAIEAIADTVVLTVAPSVPEQRRWEPEAVASRFGAGHASVRTEWDFGRALKLAHGLAGGAGTILVTGSAHTVGDAKGWLAGRSRPASRPEAQ